VEPAVTPGPAHKPIDVQYLPIGEPGNYVNVTFGFWLQFPPEWHTGFGSRPLVASFSNLDPGTHNRHSMRTQGCLIEVNVSTNVYGFTPQQLIAQAPRSFPNADHFDLGGVTAVRARPAGTEDSAFEREFVLVEHNDRLLFLNLEYARRAEGTCRRAWEDLIATWEWFTPDFAVYRNTNYGYAISYPRDWYRFGVREDGISISNRDPTDMTNLMELLKEAMIVETHVLENPEHLPLKEWLTEQDVETELANDIRLNGLIGVRVLRQGPSAGMEEMSGYFQGPLGRIYAVTCLYSTDREGEFRPIANAIIYGFSF
jgi:hypothetical protein